MTEQEQRIAIAEFCGWTLAPWLKPEEPRQWLSPGATWSAEKGIENGHIVPDFCDPDCDGELPDYLHSLDAMHEAEEKLSIVQKIGFQAELDLITKKHPQVSLWDFIHASASERAKAFLRAIGKRKE